jgi:hypothetical protein
MVCASYVWAGVDSAWEQKKIEACLSLMRFQGIVQSADAFRHALLGGSQVTLDLATWPAPLGLTTRQNERPTFVGKLKIIPWIVPMGVIVD